LHAVVVYLPRFPSTPNTNPSIFLSLKIITQRFGMSQPGRFYGIKDRGVYGTVARHFNVVVDHHGAYFATPALISRPLEEQVNTPAVPPLAFHATSSWRTVIETYSPCHTTRTTNWEIGH
jgi:hypothetical protein